MESLEHKISGIKKTLEEGDASKEVNEFNHKLFKNLNERYQDFYI